MIVSRGQWPSLQASIWGIDAGKKRLTKLAAAMAESPGQSLPQQCGAWADLKAAYRLLSHPEVTAPVARGAGGSKNG